MNKIVVTVIGVAFIATVFIFLPDLMADRYNLSDASAVSPVPVATSSLPAVPVFVPSYVATPDPVKGVYMTSWTASTPALRAGVVKLIDDTELNTVVIDIKDYSGKIVFPLNDDSTLSAYGSDEIRIPDMRDFIEQLHKKNVYVIARVAVFQDAYFVRHRPDLAVKNKAGTAVWKDYKGISWIDPGAREYWDYIISLSREARKIGFDEINFDYIRFPSDGNMQDISYPFSSTTPKALVLEHFFSYVHDNLIGTSTPLASADTSVSTSSSRLKISADLFGMVTSAQNDMGIGQVLEKALPYFDYIDPMVYPSHYPPTFEGFKEPEAHPYDVVHYALSEGLRRTELASTSPDKIRPWLQDFGLRMNYGPTEVRAQIKATNDLGLQSWLLWSASNKYTRGALEDKSE